MKGLIRRDFSVAISSFLKTYVNIYTVFIILYIFTKKEFFLMYIIGTASAIVVNILSIDERDGWTRYSLTLPYSRKNMVCSKYIVGICILTAITALMMVITAVIWGIRNELNFDLLIGSTLGFSAIGICISSLMIFIYYKFGLEKSQILMILFIVIISIVGGTFIIDDIEKIMEKEFFLMIYSLIALSGSLVIYYLSYRASVKIFEAKEL